MRTVFEKAPRAFAQPRAAAAIRELVSWEDLLTMCEMLSDSDRISRLVTTREESTAPAGTGGGCAVSTECRGTEHERGDDPRAIADAGAASRSERTVAGAGADAGASLLV